VRNNLLKSKFEGVAEKPQFIFLEHIKEI